MPISIPAALAAKLAEIDSTAGPLNEIALAGDLMRVLPDQATLATDERRGAFAVIEAFRFQHPGGYPDGGPWGTYWREMASGDMNDGTPFYSPDIENVDDEVLQYWISKSDALKHATLRARYADLAWDIGRALKKASTHAGKRPPSGIEIPVSLAHRAIDSYIEVVDRNLAPDEYHAWKLLDRAIGLALSIRDNARATRAKDAMFAFHRKCAAQPKFMWWRLDDLTKERLKQLNLSAEEQQYVIASLEAALVRHSDPSNKEAFDPHMAMNAADHLAGHFRHEPQQVRRTLKIAGEAFEHAAKSAGGLVAIAWLQDVLTRYRNVGMLADAARLEREIARRAGAARGEMKRIETPINITREDLEKWADSVISDKLNDSLARIAVHFLIKRESTEKSVKDLAKVAPLMSMLSHDIMGSDGFSTAKIGSVADDLDGRTVHHAADLIGMYAPWLHFAFDRLGKRFGVDLDALMAFLRGSPLFPPSREALVKEGLTAWLAKDAVKAIHVLVPQVEAALRDLLAALGAAIRRYDSKTGGFEVMGMGAVLGHAAFVGDVPNVIKFHFKTLYCDQRGINLRNQLAHGLADAGIMHMGLANWVVHSLLLLGVLRLERPTAT
jgi:hypothetical protein